MVTTANYDPSATVVGLLYNSAGVLCQKMKDKDGKVFIVPVPGGPTKENEPESAKDFIEEEFNERFSKTETIPHDLVPSSASPLVIKSRMVDKAVAKELAKLTETFSNTGNSEAYQKLITQWIDMIYAEHALLIRVVGSPETLALSPHPVYIKDSGHYEHIMLQIDILKGPWLSVRDKIKLRPTNFEVPPVVKQPTQQT